MRNLKEGVKCANIVKKNQTLISEHICLLDTWEYAVLHWLLRGFSCVNQVATKYKHVENKIKNLINEPVYLLATWDYSVLQWWLRVFPTFKIYQLEVWCKIYKHGGKN